MIKVKITQEQDLLKIANEAVFILVNYHHCSKEWESEYGSKNKERKNKWANRAETFISKLKQSTNEQALDENSGTD